MLRDCNTLSDNDACSLDWNIRDDLKGLSLNQIQAYQPKLPFAIAMINTTGSLNIGVALRSAVIFGASKFYIFGRRKYDRRSTVGAQNYIDIERVSCFQDDKIDTDIILDKIASDGFVPMVIEQGYPDITSIYHKDLKPSCFIFGEEKDGVPKEITKRCKGFSINQNGVLRSLNVSVAVGISLHHVSNYYLSDR